MTEVIYNSRDEYFKTPLGAVPADTELTYRIKVSSELNPVAVRLVVRYDRHNDPAVYEMSRIAVADSAASGYEAATADSDQITAAYQTAGSAASGYEAATADSDQITAAYQTADSAASGYEAAVADSAAGGFGEYAVSFTIHDTGLYWYYFEIETGGGPGPDDRGGLLLVGRDGSNRAGIATSPDFLATWQQTVYHRAYETPDWIYGGIY